eukprot:g2991.t1
MQKEREDEEEGIDKRRDEEEKDRQRRELRVKYLKACRDAHPDRKGGSVEKFEQVKEEYKTALRIIESSGEGGEDVKISVLETISKAVAEAFTTVWSERGCFVASQEASRPSIKRRTYISRRKMSCKAVVDGGGPADFYTPAAIVVFHKCFGKKIRSKTDTAAPAHFKTSEELARAVAAAIPPSVYDVVQKINVVKPGYINFILAHRALASVAFHGSYKVRNPDYFQCPICGGGYLKEFGLRAHLQSPRHKLEGDALMTAIEAARERNLIMNKYSGYTGASSSSDRPNRNVDVATTSGSLHPGLAAARDGDFETFRDLVEGGQWDALKEMDRHGSCALHYAAGSGHVDVVSYLVEKLGENVNRKAVSGRTDGRTALHWACRNGHLAMAKWLMGNGATYASTFDGSTPFHWASWQGHRDVCRWIVDTQGIESARVQNKYRCNALHWCALRGDVENFAFVARTFGVEPLLANAQGHTTLHKAAWRGNLALLVFMRDEIGATAEDFGRSDNNGYTPADLARLGGYPAVKTWLEAEASRSTTTGSLCVKRMCEDKKRVPPTPSKPSTPVEGCFEWICDPNSFISLLRPSSLKKTSHARVVDVGCGTSTLSRELAKMYAHVVGVDVSKDIVACMRRRYCGVKALEFRCGDLAAEDCMLPDAQFDVVVDKSTLDAMLCHTSREQYVVNVHRALVVGGVYVVVSFYSPDFVVPFLSSPGAPFASPVRCVALKGGKGALVRSGDGEEEKGEEEEEEDDDEDNGKTANFSTTATSRSVALPPTTYVYFATKTSNLDAMSDRAALKDHQMRTIDTFFQDKKRSMLTPSRLGPFKVALAESASKTLNPTGTYDALFTAAEKEQYSFEYFCEDLRVFVATRRKEMGETSEGGIGGARFSFHDAVAFLRAMQ